MKGARVRLFVVVAVVAAAICVRLGVWQLQRLGERKARNTLVASRMASPPIDASALPRDTAEARFRRVRVAGTIDYEHELIHASRTRRGSPGVNILTPVRIPGNDTAILVNRGWVYSPDGSTLDLTKWRDRDSTFEGYAVELPATGGSAFSNHPRVFARLSHDVVARALPYPVFPTYVVALDAGDTSSAADRIARLPAPPLDNGPHMSYAVQWFGFALVALVGAVVVVRQSRGDERRPTDRTAARGGANGPD
ncbi:MAG TPA: SURF1 family protein [Gemmatimonadaceae bacterium]